MKKIIIISVILSFALFYCGDSKELAKKDEEIKQLKETINVLEAKLAEKEVLDKYKITIALIRNISGAIDAYITNEEKAPEGKTLVELKKMLEPSYIKNLPRKDAWGNDFYYKHGTGLDKDTYYIASAGTDGIFNGFEQVGKYKNIEKNDIILKDGGFVLILE